MGLEAVEGRHVLLEAPDRLRYDFAACVGAGVRRSGVVAGSSPAPARNRDELDNGLVVLTALKEGFRDCVGAPVEPDAD